MRVGFSLVPIFSTKSATAPTLNPLVVHFSFVASSMQRDASSRKPATTEARCSAQLRGHGSSMYFGLRVHSPFDAQPAHCSGSEYRSAVVVGAEAHARAQWLCM